MGRTAWFVTQSNQDYGVRHAYALNALRIAEKICGLRERETCDTRRERADQEHFSTAGERLSSSKRIQSNDKETNDKEALLRMQSEAQKANLLEFVLVDLCIVHVPESQ